MNRQLAIVLCSAIALMLNVSCSHSHSAPAESDMSVATRAEKVLRQALREQPQFIKVHAAEALLELGMGDDVYGVFKQEQSLFESQPGYRIGIWRVLARSTPSSIDRDAYSNNILAAFTDPNSPDPVNAVETLAKLGYVMPDADRPRLRDWTEAASTNGRSYGRWLLAVSGEPGGVRNLARLLDEPDPLTRGTAAYALRLMADQLPADVKTKIAETADSASQPEGLRAYLIGAAFVTATDDATRRHQHARLASLAKTGTKAERYEALACLGDAGTPADLPLITEHLDNDPDPDVRVSAARSLLLIRHRHDINDRPTSRVSAASTERP